MKHAFVTGGSRGLGKATVDELLNRGWKVHEFSRSGNSKNSIQVDLANPTLAVEIVQEEFKKTLSKPIDELLLVSNAAVLTPIDMVSKLKTDEIISNLSVNIIAAVGVIQAFVETFRDLPIKKTILNVSSGAAHKGYEGWSLYCTAKAGMENFLNALHKEEKCEINPFRIINFLPGVIDTLMQEQIRETSEESFPQKQRFVGYKRDGVLAPPQKVAKKMIETIMTTGITDRINFSVDER